MNDLIDFRGWKCGRLPWTRDRAVARLRWI